MDNNIKRDETMTTTTTLKYLVLLLLLIIIIQMNQIKSNWIDQIGSSVCRYNQGEPYNVLYIYCIYLSNIQRIHRCILKNILKVINKIIIRNI